MKVAKSYQHYQFDESKAFEKGGKMYVHARTKCDRCINGVFVCRIENGQPVPHPNAGGICFACGGTGWVSKDIRLYTDAEFERMEAANEKAKDKKIAEQEEKIKREYANIRKKWIEDNGFSEDGVTYVYFPTDSYDRKEELKDNGFRFNYTLLWHTATVPEGFADQVVKVDLNDVVEFNAFGRGGYILGAKEKVERLIAAARPVPPSEYIGAVKDKIENLKVKLTAVRGFETRYGFSQIVRFETETGDIVKWFTTVNIPFEIGSELYLNGTIKELVEDKYENGARVTVLTRCKLREAE